MSTSVKLTDLFKNKLKKEEEGTTATSGRSITLGDHTLPSTTSTVTDRPTLPTTPGSAPTFSEAFQVTTPGVTSGNTINPELVSGGNDVPNVNASAFDMDKIGAYLDAYKIASGSPDTGKNEGGDIRNSAGNSISGESYEVEGPTAKPVPMSFEEYILSLKSKADDQYKRDILNAQNTYDQSRSAYGTQAAALGNMGLTGSGYSDYLDSRAYGQMQADKNAAARAREDTKFAADAKYMEYLNQLEAEKRAKDETDAINKTNAYTSLYNDITYNTSESDIDNLGKILGLSGDDITSLKQTRIDRIKQYLDNPDVTYTINDLNRFFPGGGEAYDTYKQKLLDDVGKINAGSFEGVSAEDAKAIIEGAKNLGADETTMESLNKLFNELYNVSLYANGGGVTYSSEGSDFDPKSADGKFRVDNTAWNGEKHTFNVQSGGKVTTADADSNVIAASANVTERQVFYYRGKLYMKYEGDVYRIVADNANQDHYGALVALFEKDRNTSN